MRTWPILLLLLSVISLGYSQSAVEWDCYEPQRGDPTDGNSADFVANKFPSLAAYKPATMVTGRHDWPLPTCGAILQWVPAIALHYTWKTQRYVQAIALIMSALSPSDQISPKQNLYVLSEDVSARHLPTASTQQGSSSQHLDVIYAEQRISPWKSAHCEPPRLDYPRWTGFPVTLCDYTDIGVTVKTYMLNADRSKQARWTVTACRDAKAANMHACIDYMANAVKVASSSGIFPIDGYIPEPQDTCYVFRDGVTVWTTLRLFWQSPRNRSCGAFVEAGAPVAKAYRFARIASTTREEYVAAGGKMDVDDLHWLDAVRMLYQQAWTSDRNELMSATAIHATRSHRF
jgi:hypothetical protein